MRYGKRQKRDIAGENSRMRLVRGTLFHISVCLPAGPYCTDISYPWFVLSCPKHSDLPGCAAVYANTWPAHTENAAASGSRAVPRIYCITAFRMAEEPCTDNVLGLYSSMRPCYFSGAWISIYAVFFTISDICSHTAFIFFLLFFSPVFDY